MMMSPSGGYCILDKLLIKGLMLNDIFLNKF
jgi:hypothetical protein